MDAPNFDGLTGYPSTFECSICFETQTDDYVSIQGDCVCKDCFTTGIKPQFEAALKDESQYPVRWGTAELKIFDFRGLFDTAFIVAFFAKTLEYEVLPGDRLFCAGTGRSVGTGTEGTGFTSTCGEFLGSKFARAAERDCQRCKAKTCSCCGSLVEGTIAEHECEAAGDESDEEKFKDMRRGTDYQKCPGCGGVVQLLDGCNHLVCSVSACRKHFCYICGEEAYDGSGHWDAGKPCPKYNQPSADNAMFDNDPDLFDGPGVPIFRAGVLEGDAEFGNPFPGLFNETRREAVGILVARTTEDLDPDFVPPDDSPELRLRRTDRRELHRIAHEAEHLQDDIPGHDDVPEWVFSVMDLTSMLTNLIELYTIHLETNEAVKEVVFQARDALREEIPVMAEEVAAEGFERFPALRRIIHTYDLALRGLVEELREQTRD